MLCRRAASHRDRRPDERESLNLAAQREREGTRGGVANDGGHRDDGGCIRSRASRLQSAAPSLDPLSIERTKRMWHSRGSLSKKKLARSFFSLRAPPARHCARTPLAKATANFYEQRKTTSDIDRSVVERYFNFQMANVYVSAAGFSIISSLKQVSANNQPTNRNNNAPP